MSVNVAWLPALVEFSSYQGNWDRYLEVLYEIFVRDFVNSQPTFRGQRLGLKRHPLEHGKEATFWHLISEGIVESERLPNFRKCERIGWPRPTIDNSHQEPHLKIWETERKGESRINIWLESHDYVVVLAVRSTYMLPWTAYPITYPHQKQKLTKDFEKATAKKADAAQRAAS